MKGVVVFLLVTFLCCALHALCEPEAEQPDKRLRGIEETEVESLYTAEDLVREESDSAVTAAELLEKTDSPARQRGYRFHFTNRCRFPVKLIIRYRAMNNRWYTVGTWNFAPNRASYLAYRGTLLRTTNSIWYYHARSTRGGRTWSGPYQYTYRGRTYGMKRKRDTEGDNDFSVICTD